MSYSMNKCDTCLNKDICKHYQYFRDNFELVVEVKDCSKYRGTTNPTTIQHSPNWGNVNNSSNDNNIALLKQPKVYPDLKELDKIAPIATTNEPLKITPVSIAKTTCDRCKNLVSSIDIDNCVECGRPVCKDCGVTTINTSGVPECTCEKCWSGTPDPDPNSTEEVKITYGEEEKEWNLEDFEGENKSTETETKDKEEELDNESRREQVADKPSNRKSKKK